MDHMSSLMLGLGFEGKGLKGFVLVKEMFVDGSFISRNNKKHILHGKTC